MARIRSIKPEFWTSAQVMECSTTARLMFIGMWNFADDLGRLPMSPKTIKAQIFPSDDISVDSILGMITELSNNGLLLTYIIGDKEYLQITGWQHQRIDKPQPGKYPSPVNGYSKSIPRTLATDLKGEDGNGEERKVDNIGDARREFVGPTERSKALADAFWKAQGFQSKLQIPPEYAGIDWRATEWERANWTPELVASEVARVGVGKPWKYYEKVFATAHAKLNEPLPKVEIREAETLQVNHAPGRGRSGNVVDAFARLEEQMRAGGRDEASENAVRLLPRR